MNAEDSFGPCTHQSVSQLGKLVRQRQEFGIEPPDPPAARLAFPEAAQGLDTVLPNKAPHLVVYWEPGVEPSWFTESFQFCRNIAEAVEVTRELVGRGCTIADVEPAVNVRGESVGRSPAAGDFEIDDAAARSFYQQEN